MQNACYTTLTMALGCNVTNSQFASHVHTQMLKYTLPCCRMRYTFEQRLCRLSIL